MVHTRLASAWGSHIETCIEPCGADRAMFERKFRSTKGSCSYHALWNAMKRISVAASVHEKVTLFGATAARVYRLEN